MVNKQSQERDTGGDSYQQYVRASKGSGSQGATLRRSRDKA